MVTIYTTGSQSWSKFIFDHPISKPYSTEAATANQALLMPFRLISVGFVSPEKSRIFIPPYLTIKSHCIPLPSSKIPLYEPFLLMVFRDQSKELKTAPSSGRTLYHGCHALPKKHLGFPSGTTWRTTNWPIIQVIRNQGWNWGYPNLGWEVNNGEPSAQERKLFLRVGPALGPLLIRLFRSHLFRQSVQGLQNIMFNWQ